MPGEKEVPTFTIIWDLIGVHKTSHTVFDTKDVVVDTVHVTVERTSVSYETSRIETTEVECASGLELARVKAERIHEMVRGTAIHGRERCVVIQRGGCVVRLRLLSIANICAVDLELDAATGYAYTTCLVRRDELDRVVVVKLLHQTTGGDRLLCLCDQHVLGGRRKRCALIGIQVKKLCVYLVIGHGECTPRNTDLDIVVLKRHERKRRLSILTEREAQGVEPSLISSGGRKRLGV